MIALLSYHFWYNYGTCLQAYALQKKLENLGYKAEYLNFGWKYPINISDYIDNNWTYTKPYISFAQKLHFKFRKYLFSFLHRDFIATVYQDYNSILNNILFDQFHKDYIKESTPKMNLENEEKYYSHFLVGSDQVWNPNCTEKEHFTHFLLDFIKSSQKKMSYASSIGISNLDTETQKLFKKYLSEFRFLSCREKYGCNLLEKILHRNITQVLDPTFLLTSEEWRSISIKKKLKRPYLLCYILGTKRYILEYAANIAKENNLDLKIITQSHMVFQKYRKNIISGVGPREFIGLLDDSSFIITDSFHGTAFAINFNKPFYSFLKREGTNNVSDNNRIVDLLFSFKLLNRLNPQKNAKNHFQCNFNDANDFLKFQKYVSINYLKKALGNQV